MKYNNYSVSKAVLAKSSLMQSLNETTCDLILNYMNLDSDLFQEIGYFDLNEKKIAIIDIYLNYSIKQQQLNYSKVIFPSEELLNDLVNILEEIINDVLDEI